MQPMNLHSSPGIHIDEDAARRELELVNAARAGSSTAFAEIQKLYSHRLFKRIYSITRNREDAEDALQDTFLRAYLALDSFEGRSQFVSWITRIAINSALMTIRKRRSRAEVSFELPSESGEAASSFDIRDTSLNPEQICDQRQRCDFALRAVDKLQPKLRTAVTTWIKQECSMKEVARTLDLSLATVKARLHRARKRLDHSVAFTSQKRGKESAHGSKLLHLIPGLQNQEQACLSGD